MLSDKELFVHYRQSVFSERVIFVRAEQNTDGRVVALGPHLEGHRLALSRFGGGRVLDWKPKASSPFRIELAREQLLDGFGTIRRIA